MQHSKNLQNDKVVIDLLTRKQYYKALNEKEYKQVNSDSKPKTLKKQLQGYTQVRLYKTLFSGQNIWLVKPSDLNRGRDIKVFNNLSQFNKILKEYAEKSFGIETIQTLIQATHKLSQNNNYNANSNSNTNNQNKQTYISTYGNNNPKKSYKNFKNNTNKIRKYVIQKYIEQPYLINERKFDIRIWAIVTQDMNLLVFREGYIRTASHQYSVSDQSIANPYIHLTNNAIQKNCQDYGQHEQGNQLSFKQFDEYLKKNQAGGSLYEELFPRMKQIILLSFESVKQKINIFNKQNCFEIFGYDFVIDKELNTWLIEVNTNPCLEESSPLLKQLIPRMMDDAFKLTVDQVFKCQNKTLLQQKQNFPVTGYDDNEILWYKNHQDNLNYNLFYCIYYSKQQGFNGHISLWKYPTQEKIQRLRSEKEQESTKEKWEKVLYKGNQGYDDTYFDPDQFLQSLVLESQWMSNQWDGLGILFFPYGGFVFGNFKHNKLQAIPQNLQIPDDMRKIYNYYCHINIFQDDQTFIKHTKLDETSNQQYIGFTNTKNQQDNNNDNNNQFSTDFQGLGVIFENWRIICIGQFQKGQLNGFGKMTLENGDFFMGNFTEGQLDGQGMFYENKADQFIIGSFKQGEIKRLKSQKEHFKNDIAVCD
ncbi:hypothetical protein PPERSA_12362 [Pseudocohnilembus persalinus]|uniref:Tubulin-tyrosine ligase/Tubulin polyglutamylase n=1 Tax=Pseudocohnilembus persalinus TaxID=266149 RepID=A0A0V0R905_PSEPJ|nr:hypothetical protein PPERSA_12362 [Pseudocohnilembus persalinus]|eukprot:KRX10741.1 hypothetical protein PPERSA_12362 [Pseudocohnilembus persalinus]